MTQFCFGYKLPPKIFERVGAAPLELQTTRREINDKRKLFIHIPNLHI